MKTNHISEENANEIHRLLCEVLMISPARVLLMASPPARLLKKAPDLAGVSGVYISDADEIHIYTDRFRGEGGWKGGGKNWKKRHLIEVLAHETYHHYQKKIGSFERRGGVDFYRGKQMALIEKEKSWSRLPWERAAERFSKKIASRLGLMAA